MCYPHVDPIETSIKGKSQDQGDRDDAGGGVGGGIMKTVGVSHTVTYR